MYSNSMAWIIPAALALVAGSLASVSSFTMRTDGNCARYLRGVRRTCCWKNRQVAAGGFWTAAVGFNC